MSKLLDVSDSVNDLSEKLSEIACDFRISCNDAYRIVQVAGKLASIATEIRTIVTMLKLQKSDHWDNI